MTRRHLISALCPAAAALLMAGCGNEQVPILRHPITPTSATGTHSPPPTATALAPTPITEDDDPIASPDQIAAGVEGTGEGDGDAPALADTDPMDSEPQARTDHPHWLRGGIFNARVAVSLNGTPLGDFRAPVDKDITLRLRRGVNTVAFAYVPQNDSSSAHLDVLESEHTPPIAPLASFRSPQITVGKPQKPVRQTFTFTAN